MGMEGVQRLLDHSPSPIPGGVPLPAAVPVPRVFSFSDSAAISAQKGEQLEDAPMSQSETSKGKVRFSVSNLPTIPESHSDAPLLQDVRNTCDSVPVLLPLKEPPPRKPVPSSLGTSGVLTATEQLEMQAAFA